MNEDTADLRVRRRDAPPGAGRLDGRGAARNRCPRRRRRGAMG